MVSNRLTRFASSWLAFINERENSIHRLENSGAGYPKYAFGFWNKIVYKMEIKSYVGRAEN